MYLLEYFSFYLSRKKRERGGEKDVFENFGCVGVLCNV